MFHTQHVCKCTSDYPEYRGPLTLLRNRSNHINHVCRREQKEVDVDDKENAFKGSINVNPFSHKKERRGVVEFSRRLQRLEAELSDFTKKKVNHWMSSVQLTDLYVRLKQLEGEILPIRRKPENAISAGMRSVFIDWLIFMTESFGFDSEILHLAVNYCDKYLFNNEVEIKDLILVGISAFFLACKYEGSRDLIPDMNSLIELTSNAFSKRDVLKMEQNILKMLDFKLFYPTAYQFLLLFCFICNVKEEEIYLALYLCDIALIYEEISLNMKPSLIAAASLMLSLDLFYNQSKFNDLEASSGYSRNDLSYTASLLLNKYSTISITQFTNLRAKYSSTEFENVSEKSFQFCHSLRI